MPINYTIGGGDPVTVEDFVGGLKLGQTIGLGQQQAAADELARKQSIAAQQAQQIKMAKLAAEARKPGGPTSEGVLALQVEFPEIAEGLKKSLDALAPAEKQERIGQLSSIVAAGKAGNVNLAIDLLKRNATAYRNAGRERDAQAMDDNARLLEESPEDTMFTLESALAANLGPEQYLKTVQGMGTLNSDVAKAASEATKTEAEANIKREELKGLPEKMRLENRLTKAQADAIYMRAKNDKDALGLGWAQLTEQRAKNMAEVQLKAGELPPAVFKSVDEAYGKAQVAIVSAEQADKLAAEFLAADPASGFAGSVAESWKSFQGQQDKVSALKTRYEVVKNSNIIQNLPPGVASDRDIQLFGAGYPTANAAPEVVSGFLRGMAKAGRLAAASSTAEAEWTAANRSKAPARTAMTINGINVAPGMTYGEFQAENMKQAASKESVSAMKADLPSARTF